MDIPRVSDDFLNDLEDLSDSVSSSEEVVPIPSPLPISPTELQSTLSRISTALSTRSVEPELLTSLPNILNHIDQEIITLHHSVKGIYEKRFPELESQAQNPIEYCKLAELIQNESDVSKIDLNGVIPSTKVIAIAISLSSTTGKLLSNSELAELGRLCTEMSSTNSQKQLILLYLQMVVTTTAPNLCALLGSEVASKVLGATGGLERMINTPACVVQVLGQQKGPMMGLSATGAGVGNGYLAATEVVRGAPELLRKKAIRMLAAKSVLAARVDYFKRYPGGEEGTKLRANVLMRLDKAMEGPPASARRPLPVPEERQKPRRGGQRVRAAKKKFQLTELRKYANRMKMGIEPQEEFRDTGEGFGMLGVTGKLRVKVASQTINLSTRKKRQMTAHNGGTESGLTSAFAFSQSQDLKLENPDQSLFLPTASSYFAPTSGFATVLEEKLRTKK